MEEYDDLEISDRDLDEAFNIGNSRKKMTKEQQIYGIWAEESAESKPKKYNNFVNFSKKSDSMHRIDKINPNPSLGDFGSYDKHINESALKMLGKMGLKQGQGLGKHGLGISTPDQRIRKHKNAQSEEEFGSWERHTMGFGSKILEKMGFKQGQGLGKHGLGITEPVKAVPRQGRATLGAYGNEKPDPLQNIESKEQEPSIGTKIKNDSKIQSWKKSGKFDQNYIKKTFAQLLNETQKKSLLFPEQSVKVVDMTGSETRVSFGYDSIQHGGQIADVAKHKNFDLPELYHNLLILVETTENSLKSNMKKVNIKKEMALTFRREFDSLTSSANVIISAINDFSHLLQMMQKY
uniref:Tuftelin-interacting protein 11 (Trinotate prediction) n=1 Tax=Myxobolus squamalis TaxID=59785 RepID=A0A6B2FVL1_MYXSQ